ncbi:hypothetical protein D3C78_671520 [compost metagenome]
MIGGGEQDVTGDRGKGGGRRVGNRQHRGTAFLGKARQLQGVLGIARQGDGQQHVLVGDRGQPVGSILVAAFHADRASVGAERHQGRGCQPGQIDAVAEAQHIHLARVDQAADEGFEGLGLVVAAGGGQVAAGALDLFMQAEITTGALGQLVAQLVYRRNHLLQGRHQLGFHAAVATQVQGLGQTIDRRRRGRGGLGHFFDGQGRGLERMAQDVVGHFAQRGLQFAQALRQFAHDRRGVDGGVLRSARHPAHSSLKDWR